MKSRRQIYIPDSYVGVVLFGFFGIIAYLSDWTYPIVMWVIDCLRNP